MTQTIKTDLYWSFRSPYSYLAVKRYVAMEQELGLKINLRPVYPIAIRNPDFFKDVNNLWFPYLLRDVLRVAEYEGLPLSLPNPDPVQMDMSTRVIAPEQPLIHRLTRLGVEAARRGAGLPFIDQVSHIIWSGEVAGWDQGDHLAGACERAGLNLADMEKAILGNEVGYDEEISANQEALEQAGHWGVPTLVVENEAFFGQDRIDLARWRLKKLIEKSHTQ